MTQFENCGRRRVYTITERRRFADLIRQHGARGAREETSRQICLNTLLKIAREFQIELKKGRRPRAA
jgi:hypothetical protein